jgi:hypothetical protein
LGKYPAVTTPGPLLRLLAVSAAAVALGTALPGPAGAQSPGDVHAVKIARCYVTKPRPFSHHPTGTQIDYVNAGPVVLHDVTFQVVYRNGYTNISRTFDDVGIFAPNEPVKHHFDAFSDVEYAGPTTASCAVTSVR